MIKSSSPTLNSREGIRKQSLTFYYSREKEYQRDYVLKNRTHRELTFHIF